MLGDIKDVSSTVFILIKVMFSIILVIIILIQDPFTHIYMYDLGFPPDIQEAIAKKI